VKIPQEVHWRSTLFGPKKQKKEAADGITAGRM